MVKKSSSPWVGCACRPSPAFTTCSCGLTWRAIRNGAPEELCRTTKMSACIAERLAAVSRIWVRIAGGRPSIDSRCCSSPLALSCGLRSTLRLQRQSELAVGAALQAQAHAAGNFHSCAAVLGADRQLAAAAVGEHDERDARRPAIVEQL